MNPDSDKKGGVRWPDPFIYLGITSGWFKFDKILKMKNLPYKLILIMLCASCKSEYHLKTVAGNNMDIYVNTCSGSWNAQMDRTIIFNEFTGHANDSLVVTDSKLFIQNSYEINKINKKEARVGIWISATQKSFEINHFKKGQLHGKRVVYLPNNETIHCEYKKGLLHGVYERKLGENAFEQKIYKKGKVVEVKIISPGW